MCLSNISTLMIVILLNFLTMTINWIMKNMCFPYYGHNCLCVVILYRHISLQTFYFVTWYWNFMTKVQRRHLFVFCSFKCRVWLHYCQTTWSTADICRESLVTNFIMIKCIIFLLRTWQLLLVLLLTAIEIALETRGFTTFFTDS